MTRPDVSGVRAREIALAFWSAWDLSADLSDNVYEDLVTRLSAALAPGDAVERGCPARHGKPHFCAACQQYVALAARREGGT